MIATTPTSPFTGLSGTLSRLAYSLKLCSLLFCQSPHVQCPAAVFAPWAVKPVAVASQPEHLATEPLNAKIYAAWYAYMLPEILTVSNPISFSKTHIISPHQKLTTTEPGPPRPR